MKKNIVTGDGYTVILVKQMEGETNVIPEICGA